MSTLATPCLTAFLVVLHRLVFNSRGRALQISLFNLSVVRFSCRSCFSSKSFSRFWNTRSLVIAPQWSLVVSHLSITLFLKYLSLCRQICSVFDADPIPCLQLDCQYTEFACWSSRSRVGNLRPAGQMPPDKQNQPARSSFNKLYLTVWPA